MIVRQHNDVFVYDCGERYSRISPPRCNIRLNNWIRNTETISTIALSHLHHDHFCGLLHPIRNVAPNVEIITGKMLTVPGEPGIGRNFTMRLLTIAPLDPSLGPEEISLLHRIRHMLPGMVPKPVYRGRTFFAGYEHWTVLWPPPVLLSDNWRVETVRRAIEAYDRAAKEHPWLAERLEQIRTDEGYRELLDTLEGPHERELLDQHVMGRDIATTSDDEIKYNSEMLESIGSDPKGLLADAARLMRRAANHLSLVIASDSGILLTGDASPSAMREALKGCHCRRSLVVTPHHGGRRHVPAAIRNGILESDYWVTSAGSRLSRHVSSIYGSHSGIHHRTDLDGDFP